MIYKIVKGNSFLLHIKMQKAYIAENKQMLEDLNVEEIDSLKVYLNDMFGEEQELKTRRIDITNRSSPINEIQVFFPSNIEEGMYGITIKGKYYGNDICSIEHKLFAIVSTNAKSHIPLGLVEGEQSGLYNAKYWIECNTTLPMITFYGAQATDNYRDINLDELTQETTSLKNKFIQIETTDTKPYIWFVSYAPLKFLQSSIEVVMNQIKVDGLYYYWTDKLVAGNDNTYFVNSSRE